MLDHEQSEDFRPLFWIKGWPIYVNTLIFILHIAAFVATAVTISFLGTEPVENFLSLDTYLVLRYGQVWRLATYIIFLPSISIMFIFAMGFLWHFGRQVEQFVGGNVYFRLYSALVLIPGLLLCLVGLMWPYQYSGGVGSIFGVFIAFATIYPGVTINIWFVELSAKGWAYVLLATLTFVDVAFHAWIGLCGLWCDAAIGYVGMQLVGAGRGMAWFSDWLEERRSQRLARERNFKVLQDQQTNESIDAILDKISQHGVGSLNARERTALERARTKLIQRDQR